MPAAPAQPKVSILVLHYRGLEMLRDCLTSLAPLVDPTVEVVLVDNGSPDNLEDLDREFAWLKRVSTGANLGFAGGNNRGLAHCRGRYVLLLNNDTVVGPRFLGQLTDYLDRHPEVGVVQGKMILPRHERRLDACGSFLTWTGFPYHYGYFKPDGPQYGHCYPVFGAKGACLMFRRDLIDRVGGFLFDEEFFCYYEETDFCHRVWLAGCQVHFVATDPIEHLMGGTTGGNVTTGAILERYFRNMTFSLIGNLGVWSLVRTLAPYFGLIVMGLLLALISGQRDQARARLNVLACPFVQWRRIRLRRRLVRSIRRVPDAVIFAQAMRNPRLDYFLKSFRGRLADYADEPPSSLTQ